MWKWSQICQLTIVQHLTPGHFPEVSQGNTNSCPTYLTGSWWESSEIMDMSILWKVTMKSSLLLEPGVEHLELFGDIKVLARWRVEVLLKYLDSPFPKGCKAFFPAILGKTLSWDFLSFMGIYPWLFFFSFSNYTYSASPQYSGVFWKIKLTFPSFSALKRQYFAGGLY